MQETLTLPEYKTQIKIIRKYNHSIDKVWKGLTSNEALSSWLMECSGFSLHSGNSFRFTTKPQGGFDGIIDCQIIHFSEPHELTYTWNNASFSQPTVVVWKLKSISEQQTVVTLEHYGFKGFGGWITKQILGRGWKKLLSKNLEHHLK